MPRLEIKADLQYNDYTSDKVGTRNLHLCKSCFDLWMGVIKEIKLCNGLNECADTLNKLTIEFNRLTAEFDKMAADIEKEIKCYNQ